MSELPIKDPGDLNPKRGIVAEILAIMDQELQDTEDVDRITWSRETQLQEYADDWSEGSREIRDVAQVIVTMIMTQYGSSAENYAELQNYHSVEFITTEYENDDGTIDHYMLLKLALDAEKKRVCHYATHLHEDDVVMESDMVYLDADGNTLSTRELIVKDDEIRELLFAGEDAKGQHLKRLRLMGGAAPLAEANQTMAELQQLWLQTMSIERVQELTNKISELYLLGQQKMQMETHYDATTFQQLVELRDYIKSTIE